MMCESANARNRKFARNLILWALFWCGVLPALADQRVTLTWNPSPDATVVGYKIYFGGATGVYTNTVTVGNVTNVTVGGLTEGATYYFSATSVSSSGSESAFSNEASYVMPLTATNSTPAGNPAPTVDPIADLTILENAGTQAVMVTNINSSLMDGNQNITVSATTSDATIIPTPTVRYNPGNNFATLTFAPVTGAFGVATVTVTVNNGGSSNNVATQAFVVTVTPAPAPTVNQSVLPTLPPSFAALTNLTICQNAGVQTVLLTNINSGLADGNVNVSVSADTSDSTIIAVPTVSYTNGNNYGSLMFEAVSNAWGTATVTVTVDNGAASNNVFSQTFTITILPVQPPTLNAPASLTVLENTGEQTVALTGISPGAGNAEQAVIVSAVSSNPALIPTPTVNYTSPNATGSLSFTPALNALGTATVTVTVDNGGVSNAIATQTFTVTVLPNPAVSQPPTLDPIADVTILQGSVPPAITLTGVSFGSLAKRQSLRITAASSNPKLIPAPMVRYNSSTGVTSLALRSSANNVGTALITVTINNGGKSNNIVQQSFTVTVLPVPPPTLDPIADMTIAKNVAQTITLTGITSGSPDETRVLRVSAASSNPRLVQTRVQYVNPASTAQLTFKSAGSATGTAAVIVTVSNGRKVVRQQFTVTVAAAVTNNASAAGKAVIPPGAAAALTALSHNRSQFSFRVDGISGAKYAVQATSDLTHWTTIQTNTAPFTFQDSAAGSGQRFYRTFYVQP